MQAESIASFRPNPRKALLSFVLQGCVTAVLTLIPFYALVSLLGNVFASTQILLFVAVGFFVVLGLLFTRYQHAKRAHISFYADRIEFAYPETGSDNRTRFRTGSVSYQDMSELTVVRGLLDHVLGTGTISFHTPNTKKFFFYSERVVTIRHVEQPDEVRLQIDRILEACRSTARPASSAQSS